MAYNPLDKEAPELLGADVLRNGPVSVAKLRSFGFVGSVEVLEPCLRLEPYLKCPKSC
jgi:hypothetical protein